MIQLVDNIDIWKQLLPLTFNKKISNLTVGAVNIEKKWKYYLEEDVKSISSIQYLYSPPADNNSLQIYSHFLPNYDLIKAIKDLKKNSQLVWNQKVIAKWGEPLNTVEFLGNVNAIEYPWDIFKNCENEIRLDIANVLPKIPEYSKDTFTHYIGSEIYIAPSAKVLAASLNATAGPIYIDEGAEIMEGSCIRGPFYLGKNSTIKMGAKIYGATSIGEECKVGGEVSNSTIFSYSNKAHDGFIGNSVIGSWCNLGADTNSSNLKNNYSKVEIYSYSKDSYIESGEQFLGVIMGDYSKTGINTMLNTGTVVGICSNIFGAGFPPKHIPPFSWCSVTENKIYEIDKAIQTIQTMMKRRNLELNVSEHKILLFLYSNLEFLLD